MASKFGKMIGERRRELGFTQEAVAKKAKVRPNYIGYLERGLRHPSQQVVERISSALKLEPQAMYVLANPSVGKLMGSNGLRELVKDQTVRRQLELNADEYIALKMLANAHSAVHAAEAVQMFRRA